MSHESKNPAAGNAADCAALADELTRVAFGELRIGEASPALNEHVRRCCDCAERLRDALRLLPLMQEALRPMPLPAAVVARVTHLVAASETAPRRGGRLFGWRGPLAAAAALALFVVWRVGVNDAPPGAAPVDTAAPAALSQGDAAELAAAFGTVHWSDMSELALSAVSNAVSSIEQTLDRATDSATLLPWSADDDWDLPEAPAGSLQTPAECAGSRIAASPDAVFTRALLARQGV